MHGRCRGVQDILSHRPLRFQGSSCWQSGHLWSIVMHFCMKSKWIVNWFPKCPRDPPTCFLTVHFQTDCDVHGASDIHSSADVFPSILWDGFFNVQTAVAPQKDPSIGLNLGRKKHYWLITQERYDNKVCWVAFSWKSWSPLQVFHLGTSIFPEVVFHPAAYRECLETGRCPWWWPGLLGPREAALQEDLIETQTLKNDQEDLEQFVACAIISEMCNEMAEESIPRPVTLILASVWMLPNLFLASQMYVPSSSSQTPLVKHTGSKQREELMSP